MASETCVIWPAEAERNLDDIKEFLLIRWTAKEVVRMLRLIKDCEAIISKHPEIFKESALRASCRLALVHPNLTMVYQITADGIVIHYCPIKPFTDRRKSFSA